MIKVNEKGFIFDDGGIWYPPLNPKQLEVFDDQHRYLLVEGCRKSSKTWGICHKALRHGFDLDGATFAIISKTIKNAKSSGVWSLLEQVMLPFWQRGYGLKWQPWMPKAWRDGCPGFKILEGPKTTGDTKLSFVKFRNRHGTVSEIQCHSLEHAADVEMKFKGPAFSGFWASEADQYLDEHAFHILCDALRKWGIPYDQHQMILDMNPPDTGTNNWFHDLFFKFKESPPPDADPDYLASIHRIGFSLNDNPQLDPRERKDLEVRYRKRKTLYNRFVLGKWELDITDGHFSDVWNEDIHVVGRADGAEPDWDMMVPTATCRELICGWDIGEMKSHSFHIMEKLTAEDPKTRQLIVAFHVLDELVVVRKYVSVADFTQGAIEKILHWEKWQKAKHDITLGWRHWSDTSAFDVRASSDKKDAAIVYEASLGKIALVGAPKYRDSNRDKVNLVWQFLHAKRLLVSAQCFKTRAMFAMLRADPSSAASRYVKRDDHKHPFDSLSYPIMAEAPSDMMKNAEVDTTAKESSPRPVFARF